MEIRLCKAFQLIAFILFFFYIAVTAIYVWGIYLWIYFVICYPSSKGHEFVLYLLHIMKPKKSNQASSTKKSIDQSQTLDNSNLVSNGDHNV